MFLFGSFCGPVRVRVRVLMLENNIIPHGDVLVVRAGNG